MTRAILAIAVGCLAFPAAARSQEACKPLTEPKNLPRLEAVVDSVTLFANLPAPEAGGPAEVVVSVMTGPTPQGYLIDTSTATAVGAAIRDRVLASIKPESRNVAPAFRVRVMLQPVAVSIESSVFCPPKPIETGGRRASFTVVAPAGSGRPRPRPVSPRIKVGVNGEVLDVDLGAGTGYPDGDRSLRQSIEGQRYRPALLDGRPVQVWLGERRIDLVR